MTKRWRTILLPFILFLVSCAPASSEISDEAPASTSAESAHPGIVVGVFPFLPAAQIDQVYGPLINELRDSLGIPVRLRTSSSFATFSDALAAGEFDVALVQPFDYPALVDRGYLPIARAEDPLAATLVATADRELMQPGLAGIAGLRIGTPPESSAMRLLLEAALTEIGIDPQTLDIQAFSTHADCLGQLKLRVVEVCAVAPLPLRSFEATTNEGLQVVAETQTISSIAFVAHPDFDPDDALRVQAFLLGLEDAADTQHLLDMVGFTRFVPIAADDYQRVRELLSIVATE